MASKPDQIEVGKTYINRGSGKTWRTVIGVGDKFRPLVWYSNSEAPDEPGVAYIDNRGRAGTLYLSSFASWVGGVK